MSPLRQGLKAPAALYHCVSASLLHDYEQARPQAPATRCRGLNAGFRTDFPQHHLACTSAKRIQSLRVTLPSWLSLPNPNRRQVWSQIACLCGETVLGSEVLRSIMSLAAQAQSWALHISCFTLAWAEKGFYRMLQVYITPSRS